MRVAIFSDNFYPELSGLADSIMACGEELGKRGHKVEFYVPRYSENDYKLVGLPNKEINLGENVTIVRLPSFHAKTGTGQGRGVIPTWYRWRRVKKFNPDVVHTNLFFGTGIEALIAAGKLKKPLVGTNHTALTEQMFLPYIPLHSKKIFKLLIKYIIWYYNKCDFVSAPSRVVIDEMKSLGFHKECHIISNPVDTQLFQPLPNRNWLRKKFNFPERTIIHAGRLASERNIDVIFKAVAIVKKRIPAIHLALAGKGAAESDLRKLAAALGIQNHITFMGFLNKPALAEAYNASKIFAITSTSDTQSMVMMQAMACGLPIIAAKVGGPAEYVKRDNGILIAAGDYKTLAKKIIFLVKNSAERKKLGGGARKLANKFSAPEIAKDWERIYGRVIKSYNDKK